MKIIYISLLLYLLTGKLSNAQVGINSDTSTPDPSAMLEVKSSNKGLLIPQVALTGTNDVTTIDQPATSLLIYNISATNDVIPGYHYWNGIAWVRLIVSAGDLGAANYMAKWTSEGTLGNSLLFDNGSNLGIGTALPSESAALDITSITQGFLPPRMTTDQRNTIVTPAEGLVIYNTDEKVLNVYNGLEWNSMTRIPAFVCGLTITVNHLVSGGVAPLNKTAAYGTITGIPGEPSKCWITSNLGSDRQATAVNDATEPSAGWYWQFNQKQGFKHDGTTRTPSTGWITYIGEESDWLTANDPCSIELGPTWHIPTYTEWYNVDNAGNWISWNGPWGSGLKMHAAGLVSLSGSSVFLRGSFGYYWSSTQFDATSGSYLAFGSSESGIYNDLKVYGYTARCVRND